MGRTCMPGPVDLWFLAPCPWLLPPRPFWVLFWGRYTAAIRFLAGAAPSLFSPAGWVPAPFVILLFSSILFFCNVSVTSLFSPKFLAKSLSLTLTTSVHTKLFLHGLGKACVLHSQGSTHLPAGGVAQLLLASEFKIGDLIVSTHIPELLLRIFRRLFRDQNQVCSPDFTDFSVENSPLCTFPALAARPRRPKTLLLLIKLLHLLPSSHIPL